MKKYFLLIIVFFYCTAAAQYSKATMDSLNKITNIDYLQMLNQLGITAAEIRAGVSGNPGDANAANSVEEKVNTYTLPDPLLLKNGNKIKTAKEWWTNRRPEIVADFDQEVYGLLPKNIPGIKWQIVSVKDTLIGNYKAIEKIVKGIVNNEAYPAIPVQLDLQIVTPAGAVNGVPLVLEFGFFKPFNNQSSIKPIGIIAYGEPTWKEIGRAHV